MRRDARRKHQRAQFRRAQKKSRSKAAWGLRAGPRSFHPPFEGDHSMMLKTLTAATAAALLALSGVAFSQSGSGSGSSGPGA
jgi:hypothetical protein